MPLLAPNDFADAIVASPALLQQLTYWRGEAGRRAMALGGPGRKVDRESALALLGEMREAIIGGYQQGKRCRPWSFSDRVFTRLDRSKPWWGFEFETGWASSAAYKEAVAHVWDNYDGCMFDGEGEGGYAVEITFCPSEMHTYLDGTAPAFKFIEWVDQNPHLSFNGGENNVGTHVNMSDPHFSERPGSARELQKFLNRTLLFTRAVNGQRAEMFGRETIYAGFFHNDSNNGANEWLEFKGFRTTYSLDVFKRYIKTCEALQKVIDKFYTLDGSAASKGVANLYDVAFNGAEPAIEHIDSIVAADGAAPMSSRMGGSSYAFGEL